MEDNLYDSLASDCAVAADGLTFVGVDPGKLGALAVIKGESITVVPFGKYAYISTLKELAPVGYPIAKIHAVIELVGAMPGQGVVSMFNFGENFGWIQGVFDTLGISYEFVRPQKWKKMFSCTSDKSTSIHVASQLFPGVNLRRTPRCKTLSDGMCEALLMAEYARRNYIKVNSNTISANNLH